MMGISWVGPGSTSLNKVNEEIVEHTVATVRGANIMGRR